MLMSKIMRTKLALIFFVLLSCQSTSAQEEPTIPYVDRIRLAEAFRIGKTLGNRIWKGWDAAPFAVLLVTSEYEFLIRHSRPSGDFTLLGYDPLLMGNVYFRKRTFPPNVSAAFPAVGEISTIVIGQAENTSSKTSTPWVLTVLHEHFHQLQNSQPNYYQDVNRLNLSRGDRTGMWMLNFPFPYTSPEVNQQFVVMSRLLVEALQAKRKSDFSVSFAAYLKARQQLEKMLSPDDYAYFSFQVWQEGIARYTEYRLARLAAKKFEPSKEFRALKDYEPFEGVAAEIRSNVVEELSTLRLDECQRVAFYPLGAGEGFLLDRMSPKWRSCYFVDKFYVEKYFDATH
jgi:hypothetical protein